MSRCVHVPLCNTEQWTRGSVNTVSRKRKTRNNTNVGHDVLYAVRVYD
jgi:hypothetical protein